MQSLVIDWSEDNLFDVRFKGGFVMTPVTGLHRNVTVLDFASMYPSIIIGANISPETVRKIDDDDVRLEIINHFSLKRPRMEGIGRYLINKVVQFAQELQFEVLYGDTDSVFIKPQHGCPNTPNDLMRAYHDWSASTPFSTVRLEFDKSYLSIILVKPKIYFGRQASDDGNTPVMKGMASKRRDRPEICRSMLKEVCNTICDYGATSAISRISHLLYNTYRNINRGLVDYKLCMKEMKREGIIVYSYRSVSGQQVTIDKSKYNGTLPEPIDSSWLMTSMENSISNVLRVCNMPSFDRLVQMLEDGAEDIEDIF
ncbi:hypothetical protein HDU87_001510 [Geranomyces variabilis]|uniref:DNA-directed DNA polymerase n=1 Tax=Geranomyces variabilis TaxID=109894 RepID=A0AAD5TCM0_9FUNG|nr:hypothetical protein HDU87_001510 [Geranomyces variabilis]